MPPARSTAPPTREQRRNQARVERVRAAAREQRHRRLIPLGVIVAGAIVVVAVLVALSQGDTTKTSPPATGDAPAGAAEVRRLFEDIPQQGTSLGDPRAPVTLIEFGDLQCPFCAEYDRSALPTIVERYVRTGKVRLELRVLSFIGPDSERAARFALAAADRTISGSSPISSIATRAPRIRGM